MVTFCASQDCQNHYYTFNDKLGGARYLFASVLGHARIFPSVRQLDINDVQFAIFAIRSELVLGALTEIATIFHPRSNSSGR